MLTCSRFLKMATWPPSAAQWCAVYPRQSRSLMSAPAFSSFSTSCIPPTVHQLRYAAAKRRFHSKVDRRAGLAGADLIIYEQKVGFMH